MECLLVFVDPFVPEETLSVGYDGREINGTVQHAQIRLLLLRLVNQHECIDRDLAFGWISQSTEEVFDVQCKVEFFGRHFIDSRLAWQAVFVDLETITFVKDGPGLWEKVGRDAVECAVVLAATEPVRSIRVGKEGGYRLFGNFVGVLVQVFKLALNDIGRPLRRFLVAFGPHGSASPPFQQ